MRLMIIVLVLTMFSALAGCRQSAPGQSEAKPSQPSVQSNAPLPGEPATKPAVAPGTEKPKIDACVLLTSEEIQSVQNEPVKERKLTGRADGGFNVSQCFFTLPTSSNSISLSVTQRGEGDNARDPKRVWQDTFHREKEGEKERDHDKKEKRADSEEEEAGPSQRIAGIGDEAFWMGSRVGGALYVLKGNTYIRISVGGSGDESVKTRKSKALAQKALARL